MDADSKKLQYEGLKWLYEMQMLDHPQLINNLKLNILMVSKRIEEVELLISREHKAILVYLKLSWMGRKFYKESIFLETEEVLSQLLTTFKFRVIDDPKIFKMSLDKVEKALTGDFREKVNNDLNNSDLNSESKSSSGGGTISQNTNDKISVTDLHADFKK